MRATIFTMISLVLLGCQSSGENDRSEEVLGPWETESPLVALPTAPLGIRGALDRLPSPPTSESVRLGRWLFFDKRLSGDGTVACATCHSSNAAFGSTLPVAVGIHGQRGTRKTPPLVNLAFVPRLVFFWDGRAASLEAQAPKPIENPIEMGFNEADAVATVAAVPSYPEYFRRAFGTTTVTMALVAKAIADYERTRFSGNSAFDRWRSNPSAPYPPDAARGFAVFRRVRCDGCHGGPNFSDFAFHNTGVAWDPATRTFTDLGRGAISGDDRDDGAFKTPTLRDLSVRAPYMHDGSFGTLEDVVAFYDRGGVANPALDRRIRPLRLTADERRALVAFLRTLSGEGYADPGPTTFPE